MARLTPQFSASRAVRDYTEQHYVPAATSYYSRTDNKCAVGMQMTDWRMRLDEKWSTLHFLSVEVKTIGEEHQFETQIFLDDLDPGAVRVELYAGGISGGLPIRQEMKLTPVSSRDQGVRTYKATASSSRPAGDYTARLLPRLDGVSLPLEDARILWQR